ncbi:MAG: T9SS type A sorting domain-containing protein [Bacteroidota bacterium]
MKNTTYRSYLLLLGLLLCAHFGFCKKSAGLATTIDLELSVASDNPDIDQWESGTFTFTLENKGLVDATGVEVRLYYIEDVVPVGGAVVNASSGNYSTRPDAQFVNIGLWENINVAVGEVATLQIELFSRVASLSFCAEVTAADQEDSDSVPLVLGCSGRGEDDHVEFDAANPACGFFRSYPNAFTGSPSGISVSETNEAYLLQAAVGNQLQTPSFDKTGNLLERTEEEQDATSSTAVSRTSDNQLWFVQVSPEGDTLLNEFITVDYPNPTSIAPNRVPISVSDGYVIGGFIVDTNADQTFRAFFVKTDFNGQSARTVVLEELDDTFSIFNLVEGNDGSIYIHWGVPGNFSLSGTNADLSNTWVAPFAGDTPSTTVHSIRTSLDDSRVYIALTNNLRGEILAYDAATGALIFESAPAGFASTVDQQTFVAILPLADGQLVYSNTYFDLFSSAESGIGYGLIDDDGEIVWANNIEGETIEIIPLALTQDGGFLFANSDTNLTLLKTDALGDLEENCIQFEADRAIDLELSISSDNTNIPIFTSETFILTLVNNGPDDATEVEVQLPIDVDRFVEVGESMPTASTGNYFQGVWSGINLAAGDSATLQIDIFNKSEIIELFAQVTQANQADVDSAPFNALCCVASEDDEAVFVSSDGNANANLEQRSSTISPEILLYPNPTTTILQIKNIADSTFYQIHDVLGKRLMEGQINDQQLDLSALPKGTYFLSIGTKARKVVRFVKQ